MVMVDVLWGIVTCRDICMYHHPLVCVCVCVCGGGGGGGVGVGVGGRCGGVHVWGDVCTTKDMSFHTSVWR